MDDFAWILLGAGVAGGALFLLTRKQEQQSGTDLCAVQEKLTGVPAAVCRAALGIAAPIAGAIGDVAEAAASAPITAIGGAIDALTGSGTKCPDGYVRATEHRNLFDDSFLNTAKQTLGTCVKVPAAPPPAITPIGGTSSGSSRGPSGGVTVSGSGGTRTSTTGGRDHR